MSAQVGMRLGTKNDDTLIDHMLDLTFGLSRRCKTSYRLREGNTPVPELFLVVPDAELGLAAAISYWPLAIGAAQVPAILLGPLVVHPQRQSQGLGKLLMLETLRRSGDIGHGLVLLMGDAPYYGRFGFSQVPLGQVQVPGPVDPKRLLYLELKPGLLAQAQGLALPPWRWVEISAARATT